MATVAVTMPRMGVSVTEGTLVTWHKQPGDPVAVGEAVCDVATDKVDTEVESPFEGVLLEHLVTEGAVVPVGAPLARVSTDADVPEWAQGEVASSPESDHQRSSSTEPMPSTPDHAAPASDEPRTRAPARLEPKAFDHRAAAARLLSTLGRDGGPPLSPAARRGTASAGSGPASSAPGGSGMTTPRAEGPPPGYEDVPFEVVPASLIRQAIAEHMARSRRTAAHMTTEVDVDLTHLTSQRAILNAQRVDRGLGKVSFLPFLARVACSNLRKNPDLNATFETSQLRRWREVNLGVAIDTERGLLVPVIKHADSLTIEAISDRIIELARRARDRRLDADHLSGGTFTISNPGSLGAVSAPAIINQPQTAILGIPAITRRPWAVTLADGAEGIAVRPILRLALTFDHRAVDGAEATRFLVAMKTCLEKWSLHEYG